MHNYLTVYPFNLRKMTTTATTERTHLKGLTRFPTVSTFLNSSVIGWCSMAMNSVFKTMQMVIARSTKGSITMKLIRFLNFIQNGEQFHSRNVCANLYHQGGHFCLDSSSSGRKMRRERENIKSIICMCYYWPVTNQKQVFWFRLCKFNCTVSMKS